MKLNMKKVLPVVTSVLLTLSISPLTSNAEMTGQNEDLKNFQVETKNKKLMEVEKLKAEKVDKKKKTFDTMLKEQGISEDELREEGSFYYDSSSEKFVIQVKKDIKDASKKEKFNKLKMNNKDKLKHVATAATTAEAKTITSDVLIEEVKYSNEELIEIQDQFFKENDKEQFSKNTILALDSENNRLELQTDSISDDLKRSLENTYGDKLHIKIDPNYVDEQIPLKARKENWNQLGSGIGVVNKGRCTTAGVAYKSTGYFLVTAGHCIGSGGSLATQWSANVGHAHLNALPSGFDFGLIRIDRPNDLTGGRYASNGLYIDGRNSSGYDARITGTANAYNGMPVCKTGITTGYTCGKVVSARTTHPYRGTVGIKVTSNNPYFASSGDSGGALTYYSGGTYRIVGLVSAALQFNVDTIKEGNYATTVYFTPIVESLNKYGLYYYSSNTAKKL